MNVKHTLKVLLCLMLSPRALAQEPATLGKVIGDVGNQYIASQNLAAPQTQSAEEIAKQLNPSPFNLKWTPRELSEYDRYNITRGIFQKNLESTSYSSVVAPLFFKKMELFCGGEKTSFRVGSSMPSRPRMLRPARARQGRLRSVRSFVVYTFGKLVWPLWAYPIAYRPANRRGNHRKTAGCSQKTYC